MNPFQGAVFRIHRKYVSANNAGGSSVAATGASAREWETLTLGISTSGGGSSGNILADLGVSDVASISSAAGIRLDSSTLDPNAVGLYTVP
ncbi:hypothetical protein [Vitiosangium sp. GDMCC 1.1324]|uniref:hypothetical protein n=1 Tax=Vitiosangium sp. (strain GDMCC 1.1324) TaxID=2138576 RepID=UPI000D34D741|nr:hypothetical protein [Vitiosangium sp. GDMCC 1.1324]PTL76216.1 hypothetical protein DAT35_50110 [Vitiosangium sp. GDMCC 1.1324]